MTWTARIEAWALTALLIFGAGILVGWKWHAPPPPKIETPAAAVRNTDDSLVLERVLKDLKDVKIPHQLPKGSVLEREEQVVVQPYASSVAQLPIIGPGPVADARPSTALNLTPGTPCPPVRLDLSLVRMPDQSHRVVASSPDGRVTGGIDIPVVPETPLPPVKKWSVGLVAGAYDRFMHVGLYLDRDVAFIRVGVEVVRLHGADLTGQPLTGWGGQVKAGIVF